jgi:hypothetical protein
MSGYLLTGEIVGAKELKQALDKAGSYAIQELGKALIKTALVIEGKAKVEAPINFGPLRASIHSEGPKEYPGNVEARVGTNLNYAEAVEKGSRPHTPPIGPLKLWAKRKLGNENIAYAIQKKIAKTGTKGTFFFKKAKESSQSDFNKYITQALDSIMQFLAKG